MRRAASSSARKLKIGVRYGHHPWPAAARHVAGKPTGRVRRAHRGAVKPRFPERPIPGRAAAPRGPVRAAGRNPGACGATLPPQRAEDAGVERRAERLQLLRDRRRFPADPMRRAAARRGSRDPRPSHPRPRARALGSRARDRLPPQLGRAARGASRTALRLPLQHHQPLDGAARSARPAPRESDQLPRWAAAGLRGSQRARLGTAPRRAALEHRLARDDGGRRRRPASCARRASTSPRTRPRSRSTRAATRPRSGRFRG